MENTCNLIENKIDRWKRTLKDINEEIKRTEPGCQEEIYLKDGKLITENRIAELEEILEVLLQDISEASDYIQ